jgi:hypothetical protein
MELAQWGMVLNFVGALAAALVQLPWNRRDVLSEAGFGYIQASTEAETYQLPSAQRVRRRRMITGLGLGVMSLGFGLQLCASFLK